LTLHAWEHYDFTRDKDFLAKRAYPVMKEAAEFLLDYMTEDPKGRLVTGPSLSPENAYVLPNGEVGALCMGPAMDSQIAYALFSRLVESSEILGRDAEFRQKLIEARARLPKPEIGKYGQLMEWLEDYEESEPGHRHVSHLYAVHPGSQITLRGTPKLAAAARKSLDRRLAAGGGSTGWSRAWTINLLARLGDGDQCYESLLRLIGRNTYANLFDIHPPFQIDGNFGGASGILEMLLQSHAGEIEFLPALAKALPSGHFRGLRARGALEVDLKWEAGRAIEAELRPGIAGVRGIRPPRGQRVSAIRAGALAVKFQTLADNVAEVSLEPKRAYKLTFE
jgi:alpha-L-fucosidase 2